MSQLSIFQIRHLLSAKSIRYLLNVAGIADRRIVDVATGACVAAVRILFPNFKRFESGVDSQGFQKVFGRVYGWPVHTSKNSAKGLC